MHVMDVQTLRAVLCEIFEQAAIWRSMQARDLESSDAGILLQRLAATVNSIGDDALIAYWELWEEEADRQAHADLVNDVGCGFRPASASEFVACFIADRSGGLPFQTHMRC